MNYDDVLFRFIRQNYDYCFLSSRYRLVNRRVIIAGNSVAVKGIDTTAWRGEAVCLASSSQDIKLDKLSIDKYFSESDKQIDDCCVIVFLNYYELYSNLDTRSKEGVERLTTVYSHIFPEAINTGSYSYGLFDDLGVSVDNETCEKLRNDSIDILSLRETYYNDLCVRCSGVFFSDSPWFLTEDLVKREEGKKRAALHNRLIKNKEIRESNKQMLFSLVDDLCCKGVRIVFVTPPYSPCYYQEIDPLYKDELTKVIGGLCQEYNSLIYTDYNDLGVFDDGDMLDPDHLNSRGAFKLSRLLENKTRQ